MEAPRPSYVTVHHSQTPVVRRYFIIALVTVIAAVSVFAFYVVEETSNRSILVTGTQQCIWRLEEDLNAIRPDQPLSDEEIASNATRLIRAYPPLRETTSVSLTSEGVTISVKADRLSWTFEVLRKDTRLKLRRMSSMDLERARRRQYVSEAEKLKLESSSETETPTRIHIRPPHPKDRSPHEETNPLHTRNHPAHSLAEPGIRRPCVTAICGRGRSRARGLVSPQERDRAGAGAVFVV